MVTDWRRRQTAALALCAATLAACAAPVRLSRADLTSAAAGDEETDQAAAPAPAPGAVAIAIAPVEDRRADPSSLGQVGSRTFDAAELKGFVDEQLAALASRSFYVAKAPPSSAAAPQLTLRPRILKAYVSGVGVTKNAVVVLEVEFAAAGAAPTSRVFRGQDASMNWANGQGEVASALRRATAACLEQLRGEIEGRLRAGGAA